MTEIIASQALQVSESSSPVAFESDGDGARPAWDRYLTIDGKRAYLLGNICGTCQFLFERMGGANQQIAADELTATLARGVTQIDGDMIASLSRLAPVSQYNVMLLRLHPKFAPLGSPDDYFTNEQPANWGIDPFWGLPHYPKVPYYRTVDGVIEIAPDQRLFEFVVPMIPATLLSADQIAFYDDALAAGQCPTAVSLSILDIKQPGMSSEAHWCLAHYLLDGHHKVEAAARAGRPVSLISFLSIDRGISRPEDATALLAVLPQSAHPSNSG